jgi:hypothetical protein
MIGISLYLDWRPLLAPRDATLRTISRPPQVPGALPDRQVKLEGGQTEKIRVWILPHWEKTAQLPAATGQILPGPISSAPDPH